jgi:hypothetical protein
MNDTRPTSTRHIPGAPLDEHLTVEPKNTPKRRKETNHLPDILIALTALAGLTIAYAAVAPHLANDTTPHTVDWTILVAAFVLLGLLGYTANHRR